MRCPAITYGGALAVVIRCKLEADHPGDHVPPTDTEACTCGELLQNPDLRCDKHPWVRTRTFDERMAFEQAFDAHIKEQREALDS